MVNIWKHSSCKNVFFVKLRSHLQILCRKTYQFLFSYFSFGFCLKLPLIHHRIHSAAESIILCYSNEINQEMRGEKCTCTNEIPHNGFRAHYRYLVHCRDCYCYVLIWYCKFNLLYMDNIHTMLPFSPHTDGLEVLEFPICSIPNEGYSKEIQED